MTSGSAYLVDTAVLAYAIGDAHHYKEPCRRIVSAVRSGALELHASVEMVQELLFHRLRRTDRHTALAQARAAADICILHPFDHAVLERHFELIATGPINGRDAIHAATALCVGITRVISPDQAFDVVDRLERIDPAALAESLPE